MSGIPVLLRQKLRMFAALAPDAAVPSPCLSVCRMRPGGDRCEGCLRTLDEIATWIGLDDAEKRRVWARVAQRASEGAGAP